MLKEKERAFKFQTIPDRKAAANIVEIPDIQINRYARHTAKQGLTGLNMASQVVTPANKPIPSKMVFIGIEATYRVRVIGPAIGDNSFGELIMGYFYNDVCLDHFSYFFYSLLNNTDVDFIINHILYGIYAPPGSRVQALTWLARTGAGAGSTATVHLEGQMNGYLVPTDLNDYPDKTLTNAEAAAVLAGSNL